MSEDDHDYYKILISLFPKDGEARQILKEFCNTVEYFIDCTDDLQRYGILSFYREYFDLILKKIESEAGETLKKHIRFLEESQQNIVEEDDEDES